MPSRKPVNSRGYGAVYVDFLKQIHDELAPLRSLCRSERGL